MSKKSFLEKERARETRTSPEPKGLFAALWQKLRKNKTPKQDPVANDIVSAKTAQKYGLILTPNETRELYEYPTISNEPQTVSSVYQKIMKNYLEEEIAAAKLNAMQAHHDSRLLYNTALYEMRKYISTKENET